VTSPERDPFLALDDYTSNAMLEDEASVFEEALFTRAANGEAHELATHDQLVQLALHVGRRGTFEVGTTREQVAALRASEFSVHYVDIGSGKPTPIPPLPAGTQLFAYRLEIDLRGYDQVDVVIETQAGQYIKTFRDVSYDPSDGALYGVCDAPLAELSFRRGAIVAKVMAARGDHAAELVRAFETLPL
jgi:hypothetical protein